MAVKTDTLEGTINDTTWFHYDLDADVLYLRLAAERETSAMGEENDEGFILLRGADDDCLVGMTIVNWWGRFGQGDRPDSLRLLEDQIEPWTSPLAA